MGKQKYFTEEERKAAKRERNKRYCQKNKEKLSEYSAKWRKENKEKILERRYKYYQEHREELINKSSLFYKENKELKHKYDSERRSTPLGRAKYLVDNYRAKDKRTNKGECTLTAEWIVDNIFSKPCHYCGESDWTKIGCDRIDSSLPHTQDNVVPCCKSCNDKKGRKEYNEFIKIIKDKNTK